MLNFGIADISTIMPATFWQLITFTSGLRCYCEAGHLILNSLPQSVRQQRSQAALRLTKGCAN